MTVAAFRDRTTGRYPISLDDLRRSVDALFGEEPTQAVLDAAGMDAVATAPQPSFDPSTHLVIEAEPVLASTGWVQTWRIQDRPPVDVPVDPRAGFIPTSLLRQRIKALGMLDPFGAYLVQEPGLFVDVAFVEGGLVDPAYPELAVAFDKMEIPQAVRDYILAPASEGVGTPPSLE